MRNKGQKLNRTKKAILWRVGITLVIALSLLLTAQYFLLIGFVLLGFVLNDVFFADHIFYDPRSDYRYKFSDAESIKASWLISEDLRLDLCGITGEVDTVLLAVKVEGTFLGAFLDPFVTIKAGELERRQYFERSVRGLRYLNLSEFLKVDNEVEIEPHYCCLSKNDSELITFTNSSLENKRILIIAPHADDAEIAAFGLYSSNDSTVITITAGEVAPDEFTKFYSDPQQAALLKGRLRAWDSVAAPLWGGVKQDKSIQLGYFCLCLEAMHESPDQPIESKAAGIDDTRLFRIFNSVQLNSDKNGRPTWNNLVEDLAECIKEIKPDIIVTPHQQVDPHPDHFYSTEAVLQALDQIRHLPEELYFYANHLVLSDQFPFGPVHTLASLPPNLGEALPVNAIVSVPLSLDRQKDKAAVLGMMHDLKAPLRWKKRLRFGLQALLIGREKSPYGDDEYFRKAIRSNELFFKVKTRSLYRFCDDSNNKTYP